MNSSPGREDINVGDKATLSMEITDLEIQKFAELTGDFNPIHMDEEFAKRTPFKKRIAHGAMITSLFTKIAGNDLPGPGSVVMSVQFNYKKPAYIGDVVTATMTIKRYRKEKPLAYVDCAIVNQDNEMLVEGTAMVYVFQSEN